MSKKIETLVDDIYDLFDKEDGHGCKDGNLHWLAETVRSITQQTMEAGNEGRSTLRASNIGKPCDRQLWFECNGYIGEEMAPHVKIKFLYGHIIEALLLFLAMEAGHEVKDTQKEVKLAGITGHMDAVIDGVLVDVKSAATYSFKKFKDGTLDTSDAFGYIPQLSFYKQAHTTDRAGFLAMDKQHGHLAFLEPKKFEDMKPRIEYLKKTMASDDMPERGFNDEPDGKSGNYALCTECKYCSHKFNCWADSNSGKGLRVFAYANGPKFLTRTPNPPKVPEVT